MQDNAETIRRLRLLGGASAILGGVDQDETSFDSDRELFRGALFCAMHSTFEFGMRQIIHFLAMSLSIDPADLWKLNAGGIRQLATYLKRKSYFLELFSSPSWQNVESLADLRNLYSHSDGWSDVNWTKAEVDFFTGIGFKEMVGLHASGVTRRFMIGASALERLTEFYAGLIESAHEEMRTAHAHP